jgi:hypothetical protein
MEQEDRLGRIVICFCADRGTLSQHPVVCGRGGSISGQPHFLTTTFDLSQLGGWRSLLHTSGAMAYLRVLVAVGTQVLGVVPQ